MLCDVANPGVQAELTVSQLAPSHESMERVMAHDHGGAHDYGSAGGEHDHGTAHDHATLDKCNMCAAFCGLTPLLSDVPTLAEPLNLTQVQFTDPIALPPSHLSDGQERPPRTI